MTHVLEVVKMEPVTLWMSVPIREEAMSALAQEDLECVAHVRS